MDMAQSILSIQNVKQTYKTGFMGQKTQVLHGVSLDVPEKTIYGLLGANGAGKTTMIQLVIGLRKPSSGKIEIQGKSADSPESRSSIGYLPERPYFQDHLTGNRFLKFMGTLSGMKSDEIKKRIPIVLEQVGLSHAGGLELKNYSKGMLQRVGIAQSILHDPQFLVLDEPMSGLDPVGRKEIRELIISLYENGKTIFFSTHIIPDVEAICHEVAVIKKGNMIGAGPIGKFLSQGPLNTEIAFKSQNIEKIKQATEFADLKSIPDGYKVILPGQEAVNKALKVLVESQSNILWVQPVRASLEEVFEKEKGEAIY